MNNYIHSFLWEENTPQCHNFSGGLTEQPSLTFYILQNYHNIVYLLDITFWTIVYPLDITFSSSWHNGYFYESKAEMFRTMNY